MTGERKWGWRSGTQISGGYQGAASNFKGYLNCVWEWLLDRQTRPGQGLKFDNEEHLR